MQFREWYRHHEAWIAAFVLALGSFALGAVMSILVAQSQCTKQLELSRNMYLDVIQEKNKVIDRLANSSIHATEKAAQAAKAAKTAVQQVTDKDNDKHDKDRNP